MTDRDPHQAHHVLRAFRYQLLQSVQAWIDLRGSEELLLEVSEDFSIVSQEGSEDVQVKHSATSAGPKPVSLRSAGVREAITRYWARSNAGHDPLPRLTFLATSGAANEQGLSFPGDAPGLVYWTKVAVEGDTAPLRAALVEVFKGEPLGDWLLGEPTDDELRARLLQRVRFALDAANDASLEKLINDQVAALYLAKNHYADTADQCVPKLLDRVFSAASNPEASERRLTVVDLHRVIEDSIPRMGALALQPATRTPPESGYAVVPLLARAGLIDRRATVAAIRARTAATALVWVQGANGVGKTTLAGLVARARGGSWLLCDFRPYSSETDASGVLPVWRELVSALVSKPLANGVILDDISARGIDLLKHPIAGLTEAFAARGAQIIVTSNHTPSPALLEEFGAPQNALVDAPYFSMDEVRELVAQDPAPPKKLIEGWAHLVRITASGGHPLLTVAKIANLRARGWPKDALIEDLGAEPSEAIHVTRQEARRRLLAELPSREARQLLERVSTVFSSFEDGLVVRLCQADPGISHPGDALTILKGSWIEPALDGGWRISPLLADLGKEAPQDQATRWRQIAAEYWLAKRTLDARTLPLCFWNAFLGHHVWVLAKLNVTIQTLPQDRLRAAAAMLSPLAAFRTDVSLFPEEAMIAASLRLLQVCVADAVEDQKVATDAAIALLRDIDAVPLVDFRHLMVTVSASRILLTEHVRISPAVQLTYLSRLKISITHVIEKGDAQSLKLLASLGAGVDLLGFLFANTLLRIQSSEDLEAMVEALAELDPAERSNLLNMANTVLEGDHVFVHNAWAKEQLAGQNLGPSLAHYEHMSQIVSRWGHEYLEAEFVIAQSVILDEGLDDKDRALAVIDAAIEHLGPRPALIRQKSKVLSHHGDDRAAAALFISIEARLDQLRPFDRALALRDGAVASANADRLEDAARLFAQSRATLEAKKSHVALQVGLRIEEALIAWARLDRCAALSTLADALEALEALNPKASQQNQRAHRLGRAAIGLFMHDLEPFPTDPHPVIAFGTASALESDGKPESFDLKSLVDNWHLLEVVEIVAKVDAGIAARSARRQGPTRIITIEHLLVNARYTAALERRGIPEALAAAQAAVSTLRMTMSDGVSTSAKLARAPAKAFDPMAVDELCKQGSTAALQGTLADILLYHALDGLWDDALERRLEEAVRAAWGDNALLQPLLAASTGHYAIGPDASPAVVICSCLKKLNEEEELSPTERFSRDLGLVYYAASSMARRLFEPRIVTRLETGWRMVLDRQRFALSAPGSNAPLIDTALQALPKVGMRGARALFEAAAPVVGARLSPDREAILAQLEGRRPEVA